MGGGMTASIVVFFPRMDSAVVKSTSRRDKGVFCSTKGCDNFSAPKEPITSASSLDVVPNSCSFLVNCTNYHCIFEVTIRHFATNHPHIFRLFIVLYSYLSPPTTTVGRSQKNQRM